MASLTFNSEPMTTLQRDYQATWEATNTSKFKKGDKVRIRPLGDLGFVVAVYKEDFIRVEWTDKWRNRQSAYFSTSELVLITRPKTMNIVQTAKNLLLSRTEKKLRKAGLKDEGGFTDEARQIVMIKLCQDNIEHLLEVAKEDEKERDN